MGVVSAQVVRNRIVELEPQHELRHKPPLPIMWGIRMADDTFETFVQRERDRLNGEREKLFNQQAEFETKLAAVNNEMRAIDAYEAAKSGKPIPQVRGSRKAPTGRRGSKRDGILAALADIPHGLTRGELLDKLGLKGNKTAEMSVSNALTALTKGNQVVRRDGKYIASMG
jgi:hypothetical protein